VKVAVTGASGLIGGTLVPALEEAGHEVLRLVRREPRGPDEVRWDPAAGTIDAAGLAGIDAAVHLAGEGIGEKRWTEEQKRRIRDSRIQGTDLLARTLAGLDPRPSVLLSASGIDYYGDGGEAVLTESSPRGEGFLPQLVADWEAAAQPAVDAGIRTVFLRSGIVLSPSGGALRRQLPLFKLGVGGPIGDGRAWWPWIAIDDHVGAQLHLLGASDVAGPVNLVAPNPARNREVAKAIGRALRRPAVLPVPKLGPRILLGRELADVLLDQSKRAVPERLLASGYEFRHPEVEGALQALLR
jgi:uncharacterized protein